ncbi:SAV_6107 family HEPN domain-containing protein [Streptomyces albus subsp. chlorinus]|uniref:SAV_6107 family HEPN domain-containing protein n=1 Tax=Streptomyces albus TaxID=1888 RepID=UPI00156FA0EF|nr:SAV_6107 family HEPN domain-containing protein [Streptomyces albus]
MRSSRNPRGARPAPPQPTTPPARHTGRTGYPGPADDIHPVLRRATAPPAALDLLAQAQHGLDEAAAMETANERYATAHLAALRTAAAVLAVRGRPELDAIRPGGGPQRRPRRPAIRSAWEVLPEVAPELAEWSALFASGAPRRARAEAGIAGAADWSQADELLHYAGMFLRLVERMLVSQPALPRPRTAHPDDPHAHPRDRRAG